MKNVETAQIQNRRKHPRFSDRTLAGTQVSLDPCAPLFGNTISGHLIDLSEGGMAILVSDLIPKKVFLKMKMKLPDGYEMDSVITVRHIAQQEHHTDFLHGVEFLNPSPEMIEHIHEISDEIRACNERTQASSPNICVAECKLHDICKRPQRVVKNAQPLLRELTEELNATAGALSIFDEIERPTAEEIQDFFRDAA